MKDEVFKILVNTDSFYQDGTPHAMVTGIDCDIQSSPESTEFDYTKVYAREDKYNDVVGLYYTRKPGMNSMSQSDIESMNQWVRCFGKSMICLIKTEQKINGWVFIEDETDIIHKEIKVHTDNDVNYNIWFESHGSFWNPVDFLIDSEYFDDDDDDDLMFGQLTENIKDILDTQTQLINNMKSMSKVLQMIAKDTIKPI